MLVGSHSGGVYEVDLPIHIALHIESRLQLGKHLVPDTGFAPRLEPAVDRGLFTIPFRHVASGCDCPQHPHITI